MTPDLHTAAITLSQGGFTCVFCRGDIILSDSRRGIAPLLELLESGQDLQGFSVADKVVGKAAAFLYRLMGVSAVWTLVISQSAACVLQEGGIDLYFETQVPAIRNRAQSGLCPMETAVKETTDPAAALQAIKNTLSAL